MSIERMMMRYLQKRGWVVFYLDEVARKCNAPGFCWLALYEQQRLKEQIEALRAELPPQLRDIQ